MIFRIHSPSEQAADHLRAQILNRRWTKEFPGTPALAEELEIDRKTIMGALKILEGEGLLKSRGPGKAREVVLPKYLPSNRLKVRILPYEDSDRLDSLGLGIIARVEELGHSISMSSETLADLKMDPRRIAKHMRDNQADAWLVFAASLDVLQWLATLETPVFALFGRRRNVDIASTGPDKTAALREAVQRLVEFGHQRIVYLTRQERRMPSPGYLENQFLDALKSHGITAGPYHMPDWEDSGESFHECLDRLFSVTPPTALILEEAPFLIAAQQHLASRHLIAPRDVSLICSDYHPVFKWCRPEVSHIHWDLQPVIRQAVYWVNQVSRGKIDRKATYTPATFFEGGTIGPARQAD